MLQVAKYRNVTLAAVVLIVATCALYFWNDRSDFPMIMGLYAVGFLSYLFLIHDKRVSFQALLLIAISLHIMALFASPNLSPDSYRFLWDGAITWMGNNPYNATPNELMEQQTFYNSPYFQELYHGLSAISQRNHSCYPTVHQFYFLLATSVSSSVYVQTVLLKLLLLCTQGVGIFFLWKLLRHFELPEKRIFLLVLNPLWLIETMGNIHFEGVMLTLLIIGLYFLVIKKWFLGALFLALAVHVKLIPIVLFPFLLRYLGWKRSIVIYIVSLMLVIVLATAYLRPENLLLFWDSLQLYFKSFKFNAFIYHYFIHYGHSLYGYYPIRTYGFILTQ
jgi:hypothetical protein